MTRNQFLTEKMGECWHILGFKVEYEHKWLCTKCAKHVVGNPDFSSWEGFGKLWEWVREQEWWQEFVVLKIFIWVDIIDPDRFADSITKYLGWEETK